MRSNGNDNHLWRAGGAGFSSKTDDWATPAGVFAALDAEFGFELDVCASPANAKCPRFFTVAENGLAQEWTGTAWMNPPYGRGIGAWMKKAADAAAAGATVVCLVPARTDTAWWHQQVMARASEVRFVSGRLKFGAGKAPAPFPSAIVVYRPRRRGLQVTTWTPPAAPTRRRSSARAAAAQTCPTGLARVTTPARTSTKGTSAPSLAIAAGNSQNKKLGEAATTYTAQASCPTSCPFFNGGGCYAESGRVGLVTARLNAAANAQPSGPVEVAEAEAEAIDALKVVPGRPLRLHTVGDCATDEAARIVAAAAARYRRRGGGPVWTYTHAWRNVSRESWGDVSVLASCETTAQVRGARKRGYATALVVDEFAEKKRHRLSSKAGKAAGLYILPCPQQTHGSACSDCRLCFDDKAFAERGHSIAFLVHGAPATVRRAKKALRSPNDPKRRLTTRELIPPVIADLEAVGERVTNAAIARQLGCNPSSVAEMRKRMAAADETSRTPRSSGQSPKKRVSDANNSMKSSRRPSLAACPANDDSRTRRPLS